MPKVPITPPKQLGSELSNFITATKAKNFVFNQNDDGTFSIQRRGGLWPWWYSGFRGGCDGLYWWKNQAKLIAVIEGRIFAFYSLNEPPVEISTREVRLIVNSPVRFETNGHYLFMTNSGRVVVWNGKSEPATYFTDWPKARSLAYLATAILVDEYGSSRVRFTEPQPAEQVDLPVMSRDFFSPEANPDKLTAVYSKWGELLLFGPSSVEVWYYTGVGRVPFSRVQGAYIERGVSAPASIVPFNRAWFWLDHEHKLVRFQGRAPEIISTSYDEEFRSIRQVEDGIGFIVDQRFYVLTFPKADRTFAFDTYTGTFAEWTHYNQQTNEHNRFRGQCSAYVPKWDTQFVGSKDDGRIFIYNRKYVTEMFNPIRGEYFSPHVDRGTLDLKMTTRLLMRVKKGV